MLHDTDIERFKALLHERQKEVAAQLESTVDMSRPVSPDSAYGRLSRQDAMQDQQMTLETRRRLELQRTQIETALGRIGQGVYGICVMCKEAIRRERLEIVPEAPLCVTCQERRNRERGLR